MDSKNKMQGRGLRRRQLLSGLGGALALAATGLRAQPLNYPSKPVKFIVPFAPGGPTDALARHVAVKLSDVLGKQVIVENRVGGGGTIGVGAVANAAPDGYTLLFHEITATFAIQPVITKSLPYDVHKDFTPIALSCAGPIFMVVNNEVGARNIKELFAQVKANPDKFSFASAGGVGQFPTHISMELLRVKYGLQLNHIPYKGTGPGLVDVAGGRVSLMMTTGLGSAQPFIDSGKMRPIAVTGPKRSELAPNIPTFAEEGFPLPELDGGTEWGVLGPAKLPREIVVKLNEAIVKVMNRPDMRDALTPLGIAARTTSPEGLATLIANETDTWGKLLKHMRVQVD